MHHRGLGMRTLGRLAMAAALIVPAGAVATASSAGAVNTNTAACTAVGQINGQHTNNGVGDNGGLLLAKKGSQQFKLTAKTNSDCGDVVDAGRMKATFTTATAINCQTATTTTMGGSGTFTWTAPDGMGTSVANIRFRWTSPTTLRYAGSVSSTGSSNNIFGGQHVNGLVTTVQSLKAKAAGGNCTATIPLTKFIISGMNIKIG
jgi:hypothetical protein